MELPFIVLHWAMPFPWPLLSGHSRHCFPSRKCTIHSRVGQGSGGNNCSLICAFFPFPSERRDSSQLGLTVAHVYFSGGPKHMCVLG